MLFWIVVEVSKLEMPPPPTEHFEMQWGSETIFPLMVLLLIVSVPWLCMPPP